MDLGDKFERIRDILDEVTDTLSDVLEDDDLENADALRQQVRTFYEQMKRMESQSETLLDGVRRIHQDD